MRPKPAQVTWPVAPTRLKDIGANKTYPEGLLTQAPHRTPHRYQALLSIQPDQQVAKEFHQKEHFLPVQRKLGVHQDLQLRTFSGTEAG